MKNAWIMVWLLSLALGLLASACDGDDDPSTDGGTGDTDTDTDTDGDIDWSTVEDCETPDAGVVSVGECTENADCNPDGKHANYCHAFTSIPPDPEAECKPGVENKIQIIGNVRDFDTQEVMPNIKIKIASAAATLQGVDDAVTLASIQADDDGRFSYEGGDEVSLVPIGIVAHIRDLEGYYLTVTGLVEPEIGGVRYPPATRNHDVWAVSTVLRDKLTAAMNKSGLSAFVPFGKRAA